MRDTYHILLVHNKYRFAGGEDSVVAAEQLLLEAHGHSVSLYVKENTEIDHYSLIQKLFLPFRTIFSLSTYFALKKKIRAEQITIVHVHNTLPLISFSAYYAAKHCNCALVQTIHNFRLLCPNGIFYRDDHICEDCLNSLACSIQHGCYRNSKFQSALVACSLWFHRKLGTFLLPDAYIALTDFNKNKLSALIPKTKLFVKPNSASTDCIFPAEKSRDYFIFVSRLDPTKGIHLLLQAFQKLPDSKLVIVGTGPEEDTVKQFLEDHHMSNVDLKGFVPHQETIPLLYHAKALIFPTQWYEGFPVVLAESLSVGTPVIGSNIGNTASIIEHGKTGLLFQHDSVKDCISCITDFSDASFDFLSMEKNCLETFQKRYSSEKNYQVLMSIYQKITKSR